MTPGSPRSSLAQAKRAHAVIDALRHSTWPALALKLLLAILLLAVFAAYVQALYASVERGHEVRTLQRAGRDMRGAGAEKAGAVEDWRARVGGATVAPH